MYYCLDTDILIEYLRANPLVVKHLESLTGICITPITILELFYGVYRSSQVEKREKQVKELLASVEVLSFSVSVYEQFGKLKAGLTEKGNLVDNFDLVIASFCMANECVLVTNNTKHFSKIDGLKLENWMK